MVPTVRVVGARMISVRLLSRVVVIVVNLFDDRGCRRGRGCLLATDERQTEGCESKCGQKPVRVCLHAVDLFSTAVNKSRWVAVSYLPTRCGRSTLSS